jgi:diguanylate cyclase (GGDEF)-like protein
MKRKILAIIAIIMIISTILRTSVVSYSFLKFSNSIILNEAYLLKDILNETTDKEKFIKIIEKSRHIKELKILNTKINKTAIKYDYPHKLIKVFLAINNKTISITFLGDMYYSKLIYAILQLIIIAFISLILIILIVNYFLKPYLEILEKVKLSTQNILKGNFNQHIETNLKGEAKEFVDSYNKFLSTLRDSFGVIENKYTALIEKEKSNEDPLQDAKETIEELANIFKFKKLIEEDLHIEDIFKRLVDVLENFKLTHFIIIGIDNTQKDAFLIHQKGEICCNILENFKECRAYRTKKTINSLEFKNICVSHSCSNNYICIPFSSGGDFTGILKIMMDKEQKEIKKNIPYIKAYLNEISSIVEAKYTLEKLHNQTIKDPLTGLFNRRFLENILKTIIANAKRNNTKIGFLMIDMDYFKKVNDTYGHKSGDITLQRLVQIIKDSIRESDLAIRYGGEEFLIILQNLKNDEDVIKVGEKIRQNVEKTEIDIENAMIKKTVSIGISIFPKDCSHGWECIKYADLALYKAKESGRNRVVIYTKDLKEKAHY